MSQQPNQQQNEAEQQRRQAIEQMPLPAPIQQLISQTKSQYFAEQGTAIDKMIYPFILTIKTLGYDLAQMEAHIRATAASKEPGVKTKVVPTAPNRAARRKEKRATAKVVQGKTTAS